MPVSKNTRKKTNKNKTHNHDRHSQEIISWLEQPYSSFVSEKGKSLSFADAFAKGKRKFVDDICHRANSKYAENLVFFGDSILSGMGKHIGGPNSTIFTILGRVEMPHTDVVLRLSDVSGIEKAIAAILPEGGTANVMKRIPRISDEDYAFGYLDFEEMLRCIQDKEIEDSCARVSDAPSPVMPLSLKVSVSGFSTPIKMDDIADAICGRKFFVSHFIDGETVVSSFVPTHVGFPVGVRYDNPFHIDVDEYETFLSGAAAWNADFVLETHGFDAEDMKSIVVTATFPDGREETFASRPVSNFSMLSALLADKTRKHPRIKEIKSDGTCVVVKPE